MSDYLTRLVQRSLGSVPTVQPRLSSYFASGNESGGAAMSTIDESDGPIEIQARQDSVRHDIGSSFEVPRPSSESLEAADAGRGEGISRPAVIDSEPDQASGDTARHTNRLAESSGGMGGFLRRLFKPKTADVAQLKQELSGGSPAIRPTMTSHSPDGGEAVSPQPERRVGLSEATTANDPAHTMPATHSRPGSSPLTHAAVSGSRHAAKRKGGPLAEEAASALPAIQHAEPEGGPQDFTASNIVSATPAITDVEQHRPEAGARYSVQQSPAGDRVFETVSPRPVSPAVGKPARQVSMPHRHEAKAALTQELVRDESASQAPAVTPLQPEAEPAGLPETNEPKAVLPRVMAPAISEPQFVREDRPAGIESPTIEVAIDRIEVRATTPPVRTRQARRGPALSLNEYLNRRGRRQP